MRCTLYRDTNLRRLAANLAVASKREQQTLAPQNMPTSPVVQVQCSRAAPALLLSLLWTSHMLLSRSQRRGTCVDRQNWGDEAVNLEPTWSHRASMFIMSSMLISVPMEMTAASFKCDSSSSSNGMPEKSCAAAFSLVPINLICRGPLCVSFSQAETPQVQTLCQGQLPVQVNRRHCRLLHNASAIFLYYNSS